MPPHLCNPREFRGVKPSWSAPTPTNDGWVHSLAEGPSASRNVVRSRVEQAVITSGRAQSSAPKVRPAVGRPEAGG